MTGAWLLLAGALLLPPAASAEAGAAPGAGLASPGRDAPLPDAPPSERCTYHTYAWSVSARRAVDHGRVDKARAALTDEERAPDFATSGCTLCEQDQDWVRVEGAPPVRVCRYYAPRVRAFLVAILALGFQVDTLEGYRPGRTRGPDREGKRTLLSNHAWGTALDVNAAHNGLYGHCALPHPPATAADLKAAGCRLRVGGAWDPKARPTTTLLPTGPVHDAIHDTLGWRWGGDLDGPLKDFMHVSPDGR